MQRKYAIALGSLFTALIEGCVARVSTDTAAHDDSGASEESGTTGESSGESTVGSSTGPLTTAPPTDPCQPFSDDQEIDRALVDGYDVGEALPLERCETLCTTDQYFDTIDACVVTAIASSTATLECTYEVFCGEGGRRSAGLVSHGACDSDDAIAAWFASMAHAEAASVTSFLRLQDELAQHGAPAELRARLWAAARDEVRHARAMRRLAREQGVEPPRPQHVPVAPRDLEALARENAIEGCVAETWSALVCAWQARHCPSPELAEIMRTIAADETRHAELAWEIDAWLRARLDDDARTRIDEARREAAARLVAKASEPGQSAVRAELGLPRPTAARTLASGLQAAIWS